MTKYLLHTISPRFSAVRDGSFEPETFSTLPARSIEELRDEERLKKALRRAVKETSAPQYLIDIIREEIRRK